MYSVCVYGWIDVWMDVWISARIYLWIYVCMDGWMNGCMYVCICVCKMYEYKYYQYIYICMVLHVHTHTYIYILHVCVPYRHLLCASGWWRRLSSLRWTVLLRSHKLRGFLHGEPFYEFIFPQKNVVPFRILWQYFETCLCLAFKEFIQIYSTSWT